ncbi:hypothetical protein EON68_03400, partial [archaeon]
MEGEIGSKRRRQPMQSAQESLIALVDSDAGASHPAAAGRRRDARGRRGVHAADEPVEAAAGAGEYAAEGEEEEEHVHAGGEEFINAYEAVEGEYAEGEEEDGGMSGGKKWKLPTAGAQAAEDGRYLHMWNEHQAPESRDNFKYGRWSPQEDSTLLAAINEYCTIHSVSPEEKVRMVTESVHGTRLQHCWKELAAVFKHRTMRSVWRRAVRLLHPGNNRGPWTIEEREKLLRLAEVHNRKWKEIGRIMNRLPNSVRNTYYELTAPTSRSDGVWSKDEEERLEDVVRSLGRVGSDGSIDDIPWTAVSVQMKTRSPMQCQKKWRNSMASRVMKLTWNPQVDRALVEAILADGGETTDEVDWSKLMPGRTAAVRQDGFNQRAVNLRVPRQ